MLELFHWESFEKKIPVYRKNGDTKELVDQDMTVVFSIYKDGKKEYTQKLEKEDDGYELELSEDDIMTFEPWKYEGEIKVKINGKTQRKTFEILISE